MILIMEEMKGFIGKLTFIYIALQVTTLNGYSVLDLNGDEDFQNVEHEKRQAEPDYPLSDYTDNCDMTHEISPKGFKFVTPFYGQVQYPSGVNCSWNFIGSEECELRLSCSEFDLRPNDGCKEEYLEVSDGVGGRQTFCGTHKFDYSLKGTHNSRDLYIQLKTMADSNFERDFNGLKCEVKCSQGQEGAVKELTPDLNIFKTEPRCFCGFQNENDRIVNGENAKMNEFPWLVAIVSAGSRSPICGGSIINDNFVLTAAHCFVFAKTQPNEIQVLVHAHILDFTLKAGAVDAELGVKGSIRGAGYNHKQVTDEDEATERYNVVDIISHPLFTFKYDYDVALLKLEKRIQLTNPNSPIPVCLPNIGEYGDTFEGKVPVVAGWGLARQDAGATTRLLQKLSVPIISLKECQSWMPQSITSRMLCAGFKEGNKDACMGDSGGPLQLQNQQKRWTQIGIVSWGEGCAQENRPGIYSRLSELIQWVKKHSSSGLWCTH